MSLITLALALAAQTAQPIEAIQLFDSVCLNGEARLSPSRVERVSPNRFPETGRYMFAMIDPRHKPPPGGILRPISPRELPGLIYRTKGKPAAYLIIPDEGAQTGYQTACAVLIQDNVYAEGKRAIVRFLSGTDAKLAEPDEGERAFGSQRSGYTINVVRREGSTLLAAIRDSDAAEMERKNK